ncbi:MAG: zinc-ribbon domain-containing protein [Nitrososphaeria archaeon]
MTKYCPKCGAPNPDDALYCSKCGSPLPAAKPPEAVAQSPAPVAPSESKPAPGRGSRAWLWLIIGLVIGLVAAGAPLMLSYNSLQGQYQALNASYWNLQSSTILCIPSTRPSSPATLVSSPNTPPSSPAVTPLERSTPPSSPATAPSSQSRICNRQPRG